MTGASAPIWVLTGMREGDNAQVRQLARATDFDFVEKKLVYNWFFRLPNYLKGRGLWTVNPPVRQVLTPPWPKVVICIGRRSVPVARWLKHQSGGYTRLVHIGRPMYLLETFDLILTTPQYRLPVRENILLMPLPLSRLQGSDLKVQAQVWRRLGRGLARPFTSVLIGGDTDIFRLGEDASRRLGDLLNAHARSTGGSLLVTTSPRTTRQAEQVLADALDVPHYYYRWSRDSGEDNPYLGLLALADDIVVTSDSASLLSDAVVAAKPIRVFDTPVTDHRPVKRRLHVWFSRIEEHDLDNRGLTPGLRLIRWLSENGLINAPRHMPRVIDALDRGNLVRRLGAARDDSTETAELKARCDEILAEAVGRIRVLVNAPR